VERGDGFQSWLIQEKLSFREVISISGAAGEGFIRTWVLHHLLRTFETYTACLLGIWHSRPRDESTWSGTRTVAVSMRRVSSPLMLAACYLATATTAQPSYDLFERASTCSNSDYNKCSQPGLPSSFCCPSTTTCIPLAANTTVICCPNGSDCSSIKPITCDITQQNSTLNPSSTLQTTALASKLLPCGPACCPFGYSCNDVGQCVKNANQNLSPASSSAPSSTASSTSTQSASAIPVPVTSNCPNAATARPCSQFPVTALLVGFFPGLIAGALLAVLSMCLFAAHRHKSSRRKSGSSFGNISDPQPSGADMRTDFLRKQPATPSTGAGSTPSRRNTMTRMRSIFRRSTSTTVIGDSSRSTPVPPIPLNVQRPMMQMAQDRPITPHLQREPSYEDINIFADGDTASSLRERERLDVGGRNFRASHQTTFTDMMERSGLAGLQKGQPYVYQGSPNYTSPPPRHENPRGG